MISVIVVSYYSGFLLQDLVRNVKDKLAERLGEIIIVDNAREGISSTTDMLVIVSSENLGYGAAVNLGVRNSNFEEIIILNPDNRIVDFESKFEIKEKCVYGFFRLNADNFLRYPRFYRDCLAYMTYKTFGLGKNLFPREEKVRFTNECEKDVDWITGDLMWMHRRTFDYIGGFDENFFLFYEETDFCRSASMKGVSSKVLLGSTQTCLSSKSSSSDVSKIKIQEEIKSFFNYHNKEKPTSLIFFAKVFFVCYFLLFFLFFISVAPLIGCKYYRRSFWRIEAILSS